MHIHPVSRCGRLRRVVGNPAAQRFELVSASQPGDKDIEPTAGNSEPQFQGGARAFLADEIVARLQFGGGVKIAGKRNMKA